MFGFYIFMTLIIGACVAGAAILVLAIICLFRILYRNAFPKRAN